MQEKVHFGENEIFARKHFNTKNYINLSTLNLPRQIIQNHFTTSEKNGTKKHPCEYCKCTKNGR